MQTKPMTPRDAWQIVQRRKWSLILPFLIVALAGAGMAISLPTIYRSTARILIEEQDIPQNFVATTVQSYAKERMQQINQHIMSFSRLVEIIDQFGLYPELKEKWTTGQIVAKMKEDTILESVSAEIIDRRTGRSSTATISFNLSYQGKDPIVVQQVTDKLTTLFLPKIFRRVNGRSGKHWSFWKARCLKSTKPSRIRRHALPNLNRRTSTSCLKCCGTICVVWMKTSAISSSPTNG
jgi:hypothetical protein